MIPEILTARENKKVLDGLMRASHESRTGAKKGLTYAGKFFLKTASDKIKDKTTKTGRIYLYKGRRHQASAPGEYFANMSGKARRAIGFNVTDSQTLFFGNRLQGYPVYLELGTRKMKPRPVYKRTILDNEVEALDIVGNEIFKELTKGA